MEDAPVEILALIFELLPKYTRDRYNVLCTCKRWCFIGRSLFDPSERDDEAICYFARQGNVLVVRYLLSDSRVSPAANRNQPIRAACAMGHLEVVKLLLRDPRVDPRVGEEHDIPLVSAVMSGDVAIALELLQHPLVNAADNQSLALRRACQMGRLEMVKLFLSHSYQVDSSSQPILTNALEWACQYGHLEIIHLLLQDGRVDPSLSQNFALRAAARSGNAKAVRLLLDDPRVDPSDRNNEALRHASSCGNTSVVLELLQDHRINPLVDDMNPIRSASFHGHLETLYLLLTDHRVGPVLEEAVALILTVGTEMIQQAVKWQFHFFKME